MVWVQILALVWLSNLVEIPSLPWASLASLNVVSNIPAS
jgi:hypothetical protein